MFYIFVTYGNHENILTTKISRLTVSHILKGPLLLYSDLETHKNLTSINFGEQR